MPRPHIDRRERMIRFPAELDAKVVRAAEKAGVSVNEWLARVAAEKVSP